MIQQAAVRGGVVVQNTANSRQNFTSATRGLGIAQIVVGSSTILFGILVAAILHYWVGSVGFGIWGGIWVCMTLA